MVAELEELFKVYLEGEPVHSRSGGKSLRVRFHSRCPLSEVHVVVAKLDVA